ncbi:hypothetical protein [uncultured Sunxiuqinia sp.]|uniref:hypothetical protein n=1 Tax=uncultured Sunxiuqinia sp. TaxID=1573825 RepID=UPI002AA6FE18|nr:hypothetical protein [uncultured Sunxiuqinia sp.]
MVLEVGGEDINVKNTYDMLKEVVRRLKALPDEKGLGGVFIGNLMMPDTEVDIHSAHRAKMRDQ